VLEAAEAPQDGDGQGSSAAHELLGLEGARSCLNGDFLDTKKKLDGDDEDGGFSSEDEQDEKVTPANDSLPGGGTSGPMNATTLAAAGAAAAKTSASTTAVDTVVSLKTEVAPPAPPAGRALPFGKKVATKGKGGKPSDVSKAPSKARDSTSSGREGSEQKAAASPALGFKLFVPNYIKK